MDRESGKLYSDPLYGTKILSPLAVEIIDTAEFQRLNEMRQLGLSDTTYRGARHSRFEHSVGTYFLVRSILRRIEQNHERMGFAHPGCLVSKSFRHVPANANAPMEWVSPHSCWRGVTEVVSAAALLHDLSHVPFGHAMEDEFAGLYEKHDGLANPRLYWMLFHEQSELADVFSEQRARWIGGLKNEDVCRLIYVILSWKEDIRNEDNHVDVGFREVLDSELQKCGTGNRAERLVALRTWHAAFVEGQLFHPFMSDAIGDTICADLLDYIARDRQHVGMELRFHSRLQRYFTIRPGSLYPEEGLRVSIRVGKSESQEQRRDVATAVMDVMRDRYEMIERIYYHHKKAAATCMAMKLLDLVPRELRPRDDDSLYPAPWSAGYVPTIPHLIHLSDSEIIRYAAEVEFESSDEARQVRAGLYAGLRYQRRLVYRTLVVIDYEAVVQHSKFGLNYIVAEMRQKRVLLEKELAAKASVRYGDILVFCPTTRMQRKETNARVEITEGKILPLARQHASFACETDLTALDKYYDELWRAYIFVQPDVYKQVGKCDLIMRSLCDRLNLPLDIAYQKYRGPKSPLRE